MVRGLMFSLLLALGIFAGSQPSHAESVRWPATGDPAFAFEAPAGWNIVYDKYGNCQFMAADRSAVLQLTMDGDPDVGDKSTAEIAAEVLKAADASPYSKTGSREIVSRASDAFYSDMVINNTHLNVMVVVVKIDATHVALVNTLTKDNLLPAQTAALDTLVAAVRVTGVK